MGQNYLANVVLADGDFDIFGSHYSTRLLVVPPQNDDEDFYKSVYVKKGQMVVIIRQENAEANDKLNLHRNVWTL